MFGKLNTKISEQIKQAIYNELITYINKKIENGNKIKLILNTDIEIDKDKIISFSEITKDKLLTNNNILIEGNLILFHPKTIELKPEVITIIKESKMVELTFEDIMKNILFEVLKASNLLVKKEVKVFNDYKLPTDIGIDYVADKLRKLNKVILSKTGKEKIKDFLLNEANNVKTNNKYTNLSYTLLKKYLETKNILRIEDNYTFDKIQKIKENIKSKIIGQDDLIDEFFNSFYQYITNNAEKNVKPLNTLLTGPTGVGKTYFIKLLAKELGWNLIIYNMEEFQEGHTKSAITGTSAGYVGYGTAETLAKKLQKERHNIILFDEMEKADVSVLQSLLTLLDEGYIKDLEGNVGMMKNGNLIFFTSNLFTSIDDVVETLNKYAEQDPKNKINAILYKGINNLIKNIKNNILVYVDTDKVVNPNLKGKEAFEELKENLKAKLEKNIQNIDKEKVANIIESIVELNTNYDFLGYKNITKWDENTSKDIYSLKYLGTLIKKALDKSKSKEIKKAILSINDKELEEIIYAIVAFYKFNFNDLMIKLSQILAIAAAKKTKNDGKQAVSPEFLGRLQTKLFFNPIGMESMKKIIELEFKKIVDALTDKKQIEDYNKIWEMYKENIIRKMLGNKDEILKYGGRNIKNSLQTQLKNALLELNAYNAQNNINNDTATNDEEVDISFIDEISDFDTQTLTEVKNKNKLATEEESNNENNDDNDDLRSLL